MKLSKWKVEMIVVAILLQIAGGIWWYTSTADSRVIDAEFKQLTDYANRQTVEIAIIRQAAELRQLKAEFATEQQKIQDDLQNKLKPTQE